LFFLNADDAFCDERVLADVCKAFADNPELELIFGNVVYVGSGGARHRSFHWVNSRNIFFGDLCHQAVFARKALFDRCGGYDLSYPINADYDWLLRVFRSGVKYRYINRDIATFAEGGFHTKDRRRQQLERQAIKEKFHSPLACKLGYWRLRVVLKLRKMAGQDV
jgi:GT2 family glycosyltransferase